MMQVTATFILLFTVAVGRGALADDPNIQIHSLNQRVSVMEERFPELSSHLDWVDGNPDFTQWVKENQFAKVAGRLSRVEEQQQQQCACLPKGVSFACPSGYVEVAGRCLLFSNNLKSNYSEAKNICLQAGGQLAIIDNCNLLYGIASYLGNDVLTDSKSYWVGASDAEEEGTWTWIDGTAVDMRPIIWGRRHAATGAYEPDGGVADNCLLMSTQYNFRFADFDCDHTVGKSPVCQYNDDTCSSPRVLLEGRCLEFRADLQVDWSDACAVCAANGGQLAKVDDCNLMSAIMVYLPNAGLKPKQGYWVGGSDSAVEGNWVWLDGTPVPMGAPFWDQHYGSPMLEPSEVTGPQNCGALRAVTRWMLDDQHCGIGQNTVCEALHIINF